jgi:hypothetical protein
MVNARYHVRFIFAHGGISWASVVRSAMGWRESLNIVSRAIDHIDDKDELAKLVSKAEVEISTRFAELGHTIEAQEERTELSDATQTLLKVRTDLLGWPSI